MNYPNNPSLQQSLLQIDQEAAQKKASLMQNFYSQQNNMWGSTPAPTSAQTPTQNVSWITVNGLQGAKDHQVPANGTHWMMDSNDSVFYVKSADEFGASKQLKAFRFSEIEIPQENEVVRSVNMDGYVSREEFENLKEKIDQIADELTKKEPTVKEESSNAKSTNGNDGRKQSNQRTGNGRGKN